MVGLGKGPRRPSPCLAWLLMALPLLGGWTSSGPFGGSARAIAIDPQNRNVLLVGARDSLIFRSGDAGSSWRLLPFPRGTPGVFNSVIIHPLEPGHFYAGLDAGDSADSGVYESFDAGESWQLQPGMRARRIESLAMLPSDPRVLAAGTSKGVFLSTDGGRNWQRISPAGDVEMQDITAIAFDPGSARTIYAGTPHLPWKTADGGATWRSIHSGLIDDSDIFSIRVDPTQPDLLLASACSGIYRSNSAGESWLKLQGIPGTHRRTHIIAQEPGRPEIIYAGTTLGLLKSQDGGRTWHQLTFDQVNWMAFDPVDPRTLYLATEYAGVLKSANAGETFHPVNAGFADHRVTQITGSGTWMYASSTYEGTYGGVFASEDGQTWTLRANEQALLGRNLNSLIAAAKPEGLLFGASEDAVLRSADGGRTWIRLPYQSGAPGGLAKRIRIHALRAAQTRGSLILLAGTDAGLFRSLNSGTTWTHVPAPGIAQTPVIAIFAPPGVGARIAAQTNNGLFLSDDAGLNWRSVPLPDSSYYIYDVGLPSGAASPILIATSRGLLQSADDGRSWKLITSGLPAATVTSVRFHPEQALQAFLVQYGKIYRSMDGGTSWTPLPSEGLSHTSISSLWSAPDRPNRIFALSATRGVFMFDLPLTETSNTVDEAVFSKKQSIRGEGKQK